MRNIILTIAFLFFSFFSFVSAQYTYTQLGTRFLVGKERSYFGSEKVQSEMGPFFLKINPSEATQNLGEIFPQVGLNGRGLFYNFSPNGIAHICELEGTTKVVRSQDGKIYATVCGNLLVFIEAFEKEKAPEKVSYQPPARREKVVLPPDQNYIVIKEYKVDFWEKSSYGCYQETEFHGGGTPTGAQKTILSEEKAYFLKKKEIFSRGPNKYTLYYWK